MEKHASSDNSYIQVNADHYFYTYSDKELIEVIAEGKEWTQNDIQLAIYILKQRGTILSNEEIEELQRIHNHTNAIPDQANTYLLIAGYVIAAFGSLIGLVIGIHFMRASKWLPDGRVVYKYNQHIKKHGKLMIMLTIISTISYFIYFSFIN